jgi:16S rRNA (uracil1498-N3)-methyltransferase
MDLILQKSVELGVSRIQPLWMQRCQTRISGERMEKRLGHWQGVIISACEQSGRSTLPELDRPEDYGSWISRQPPDTNGLMLQPDSTQVLNDLPPPEHGVVVLVGPEGGLNPGEQRLATQSGFTGIRLGQRILRTETAALSALAGMHTLWGDFRAIGSGKFQ